jgi:hypothetical protein
VGGCFAIKSLTIAVVSPLPICLTYSWQTEPLDCQVLQTPWLQTSLPHPVKVVTSKHVNTSCEILTLNAAKFTLRLGDFIDGCGFTGCALPGRGLTGGGKEDAETDKKIMIRGIELTIGTIPWTGVGTVKEHGSFSPTTPNTAGGEVGQDGVRSNTILGG